MFSKVFKYDFKYVFRFWWIFAVTSLGVSALAGFLLRLLIELSIASSHNELQSVLAFLCALGLFALIIVLCIFPIASSLGCAIRYYKNFFSDEGYLTFTLPVSRTTLLNSKIANDAAFSIISVLVLLVDALIIGFIGSAEGIIEFFRELGYILTRIDWNGSLIVSAISFPLFLISSLFMGACVLFLSITIGSIIAKKHKVLASIGVYYGISALLGFIQQLFSFIPSSVFYNNLSYASAVAPTLNAYILLSTILYLIIGIVAYFINLYCLKNKLNLS